MIRATKAVSAEIDPTIQRMLKILTQCWKALISESLSSHAS
jgi:hypothetical protein